MLVVDDNATNRHILEEWLRGWQMEPAAVGDGLAALDALWDAVSVGRPYALVLLDARMPDTDGLALAAKIRKRPALSATRIILLTSGERPGDWDRIREQRIDAHLLKPVQQDELLETIYRVMSRANGDAPPAAGHAGGPEPAAAPVPAAAPLRILVAEDNEINAQLLERLLARRGHRVRLANNGRRGAGPGGRGRLRPAAPGCPHAGAGRLPGDPGDPRAGAVHGGPPARHRLDRPRGKKTASGAWRPAWTTSWPSRSRPPICGRRRRGSRVPVRRQTDHDRACSTRAWCWLPAGATPPHWRRFVRCFGLACRTI